MTPDVPHRIEIELEVPGTPEQVWQALATARGISAWFLPTESEERLGGRLVTHMGPDDAPADIVGWNPPHRFVYEEDIAELAGQAPGSITPLTSEFLVEARSGGTCVVRVVSSAFGVGADWENEFFEQMKAGWVPYFEQLRVYLSHFPGQQATTFTVDRALPGTAAEINVAVAKRLGGHTTGDRIELAGTAGFLEQAEPVYLLRLESPVPGMLRIATGGPSGATVTEVGCYLFPADGSDVSSIVDQQKVIWSGFLESLAMEVAS